METDTSIDIGIDAEQREAIAGGLARLLADTYTLYLKTHNFHWNVTGPMFGALHTMFETQYEPTADLLTQRMQVHEKNAWMLRSLLER